MRAHILTNAASRLLASLCAATLLCASAPSQDDYESASGIDLESITPAQVANVATLGKVWGFLKYHHPRVTSGDLQWDHELFRILPSVLEQTEHANSCAVIADWAAALGDPDPGRRKAKPPKEDAHLTPDLDWIREADRVGAELSALLQKVHEHRHRRGKQAYVSLNPGVGNPDFSSELAYEHLELPDAGYRILALFRMWNIIEYWFPYRDLLEDDWDAVLTEFLPRIVEADSRTSYQQTLILLMARIHDTHTNLWSSLAVRPPVGQCQLPVLVRFVGGEAVVRGTLETARDAVLQVGDVIEALDGESVRELVARWAPYYAASNEPTRLRDIARSLTRGDAGPCKLRIRRGDTTMELESERVPIRGLDLSASWTHDRPGDTFQRLSEEVAYLKMSSVDAKVCDEYIEDAEGTRGLVIDIRNYPSDFVVFALGQHLVDETTEFARFTNGVLSNPGAFEWTRPLKIRPRDPMYEGRVVILIDETSQSNAEYTTMAFRVAPDATVVGSTTAGADGNVSPIHLPGGLRCMITGIGVFYPDKTPTQRIGIVPDVEVRPTLAGIRAGRDEVLERALRLILGPDVAEEEIRRMAMHDR